MQRKVETKASFHGAFKEAREIYDNKQTKFENLLLQQNNLLTDLLSEMKTINANIVELKKNITAMHNNNNKYGSM